MARVNYDIVIDFKVSKIMKEQMEEAERLDAEGSVEYDAVADIIDVLAKEGYVNHLYTKEQWDKLVMRYPIG